MVKKHLSQKFRTAANFIEGRVPAFVVRDKITRFLICAAVFVYFIDMWDPLPIGESIAIFFISLAILRSAQLKK